MEGEVLVEIIPGIEETSTTSKRSEVPASVSHSSSFWRRSLTICASSMSKSRSFKLFEDSAEVIPVSSPYRNSPKTPLMISGRREEDDEDEDDDDEVYVTQRLKVDERKHGKKKHGKTINLTIWIEWIAFLCILGLVIASLTINKLWKWCVLVLVIFCGRLVTGCFSKVLAFLIDKNTLLKNVLYFLYELRNSIGILIWLGLILLAWALLINRGVERSRDTERTLNKITRGIACTLIGAALWTAKTFLMKLIASKFYLKAFFDNIRQCICHEYVRKILSGGTSAANGQLSFSSVKEGKLKEGRIDVPKLRKIKRDKVSAWTMSGLIAAIRSFSGAVDETNYESEAKDEAQRILEIVQAGKHEGYDVEKKDLEPFMPKEEVDNVISLFEGKADTRQKSSFKNWMVNVYDELRCLASSLNCCKTAIDELNVVVSVLVLVVVIVVWLLLMEITTTEVLVFITSQLLLWGFMFGNTLKTLFEGTVFTFAAHPFDVGDECLFNVDGEKEELLIVHDMKLMTTTFKNKSNEKIHYPNSALAAQRIINRGRPKMAVDDAVEMESTAAEGQDKSVLEQ